METPNRGWEHDGGERSQREKRVEGGSAMEGEREGQNGQAKGTGDCDGQQQRVTSKSNKQRATDNY